MRMKNFLLRKLFLNVFLFVPVYRSSQHYSRHANTSFTIENEKQNRMSILDVQIIHDDKTFASSVYRKPICTGVYAHFDSILPSN